MEVNAKTWGWGQRNISPPPCSLGVYQVVLYGCNAEGNIEGVRQGSAILCHHNFSYSLFSLSLSLLQYGCENSDVTEVGGFINVL